MLTGNGKVNVWFLYFSLIAECCVPGFPRPESVLKCWV